MDNLKNLIQVEPLPFQIPNLGELKMSGLEG